MTAVALGWRLDRFSFNQHTVNPPAEGAAEQRPNPINVVRPPKIRRLLFVQLEDPPA